MNQRELAVQPESAPLTGDESGAFATLLTQRHRRHGTTSFERHCMGIGLKDPAQNVPMLEKSQYQNQMISPVPPQAAT